MTRQLLGGLDYWTILCTYVLRGRYSIFQDVSIVIIGQCKSVHEANLNVIAENIGC